MMFGAMVVLREKDRYFMKKAKMDLISLWETSFNVIFCLFLVSGYYYSYLFVEFFFLDISMALGSTWLRCLRKKFKLSTKVDRISRGTINLKIWKAGEHNEDRKGSGFLWYSEKTLFLCWEYWVPGS